MILATRLLWEKGVGVYVEAARILRAEGRDIEFLLAGEPDPGNPASVAPETIQAWTRDGVVHWLGHVEDMPTLLRTVDVMVLPSYYREGVPRVLVEGAATGLPLVTTDMPGCREIVSHGVNGFLVPPREAEPVARAVGSLQDEPGLARRMGQASREKALDEYAQGIVFERTVGVYDEVRASLSSGRYRSRRTLL